MQPTSNVLALDVGTTRIGVAIADVVARIPRPLVTLTNDDSFRTELQKMIRANGVKTLVVGLPRGLDGQDTQQTAYVRTFVQGLDKVMGVTICWQDEAVTSKQAEAELQSRGKPYKKGDIDALAATYILEDYIREHQE